MRDRKAIGKSEYSIQLLPYIFTYKNIFYTQNLEPNLTCPYMERQEVVYNTGAVYMCEH